MGTLQNFKLNEVIEMGNKNIKKEVKKKKSTGKPVPVASLQSIVTQPELVKKPKKTNGQDN